MVGNCQVDFEEMKRGSGELGEKDQQGKNVSPKQQVFRDFTLKCSRFFD